MGPAVVRGTTVSDAAASGLSEQPDMDTPMMRKMLKTMKIIAERSMHNDSSG
jgi:hypothetical protein